MIPPRPAALRLWTRVEGIRLPAPPLGLLQWTPDATALAVLVDATHFDGDEVQAVATQIPLASDLPPGSPVFVLGTAVVAARSWRAILGPRRAPVSRAVRCSALLARGYVDIGCARPMPRGDDLAWGWSQAR